MKTIWLIIGVLATIVAGISITMLSGCSNAPTKTDITCQAGHGTCYVVHCEGRATQECESFFKSFCPKGFEDQAYGIVTEGHQDRLVTCK